MNDVKKLIPTDKFDDSHIDDLKKLSDDDIRPILPDLLEWLQDYNWPVADQVLSVLIQREDDVTPLVLEVLRKSSDVMWKYWLIDLYVPQLSSHNKALLYDIVRKFADTIPLDEDEEAIVEAANSCLKKW